MFREFKYPFKELDGGRFFFKKLPDCVTSSAMRLGRRAESTKRTPGGVVTLVTLPRVTDAATMRKIFLLEVLGGESKNYPCRVG
jgi:hypothetical protein